MRPRFPSRVHAQTLQGVGAVGQGLLFGAPLLQFPPTPKKKDASWVQQPATLALGSSAIVTSLGQNDTFVFWVSLQQLAFASQKVSWSVPQTSSLHWPHNPLRFFGQIAVASEKVLWRVPPTILYICLPHVCCVVKNSSQGSANCALHLSPSLLLGSKLRELLTCLTQANRIRRNRPIVPLLLGYSLGLLKNDGPLENGGFRKKGVGPWGTGSIQAPLDNFPPIGNTCMWSKNLRASKCTIF